LFKAIVKVTLKKKILDPQGKAIESSLHNLGFSKLSGVRTGKNIEMLIDEADLDRAKNLVQPACTKLLANPVTEDYEYKIFDKSGVQVASGDSNEQFSLSTAEPQPVNTMNGRVAESGG
jgi:phosphoribosylformylglycinamidine synthase